MSLNQRAYNDPFGWPAVRVVLFVRVSQPLVYRAVKNAEVQNGDSLHSENVVDERIEWIKV